MADTARKIVTVLEPDDEYPHEPDEATNYNESMYLNGFDVEQEVGGWFRLGNRVNEGYAEMSVCLYLPGGRVGFMFGRPRIETNAEMKAGGLTIEVVEPFEHLTVAYEGKVVLLDQPADMADPRSATTPMPVATCSSTCVASRRCTAGGRCTRTAASCRSTRRTASPRPTTSSTRR
ncbi:MAG TPA: hypothetical protein VM933_09155 [Acidimicrobiales bacterium]|nr:hypothetical protein [Acidimicrobiales bacterium]